MTKMCYSISLKKSLGVLGIFVFFVVSVLQTVGAHETDLRKELILNYREKVAFDKFKSQVWENITARGHGLMKTDLFLLRWIRAKRLDVGVAIRDMKECLEWRRVNRLDTIHKEDWSDMQQDYPYRMDILDLQGRPVAMGSIGGEWNVRRGAFQGKMPRMTRYTFKLVEELFDRLYEVNQKHPNVTQFSVIASLDGFNLFQQACPVCLTLYVQLLTTYNRYYPNFAHAIIAVNTPQTFRVVLDLVRPMLNKGTSDALSIHGYNKNQWKLALDKEVSPDQRTEEFGGTMPDNDDDDSIL